MPFFTSIRNNPQGERQLFGLFLLVWSLFWTSGSISFIQSDLLPPLREWQGWEQAIEVRAEVVRTATSRTGRGRTTQCLNVEYQYPYQGRMYTSHRIRVIGKTCTNRRFITWQDKMQLAQRSGTLITAWVHPKHPDWAVLDNDVSALTVLKESAMLVVFGLIGISGLVSSLCILWPHSKAQREEDKASYPLRAPRNPRWVNKNHEAAIFVCLWFGFILAFVLIWAFSVADGSENAGQLTLDLMNNHALLVLMLASLLLSGLYWFAQVIYRWWPWQGVNLTMRPNTPRLGDTLELLLTLPSHHLWPSKSPDQRVTVTLAYPDKAGKSQQSEPTRWQQSATAKFHRPAQADAPYEMTVSLALPTEVDGRPSGLTARGKAVTWTLEVTPTARASAPLCIEFFVGARANAGDPLDTPADLQGTARVEPPSPPNGGPG